MFERAPGACCLTSRYDNACKQAERQIAIAREVMAQKHVGNNSIRGLMLESFLEPGRQDDSNELLYGGWITDPCIGWERFPDHGRH